MQGHLAQEIDAIGLGVGARPAMAENIAALAAFGAVEKAHILDDTEHRHVDLAKHVKALAGIQQGDVLRG